MALHDYSVLVFPLFRGFSYQTQCRPKRAINCKNFYTLLSNRPVLFNLNSELGKDTDLHLGVHPVVGDEVPEAVPFLDVRPAVGDEVPEAVLFLDVHPAVGDEVPEAVLFLDVRPAVGDEVPVAVLFLDVHPAVGDEVP